MRGLLQWSVILLATGAAAQEAVPGDSPPSTQISQPAEAVQPAPAGRTVAGRVVDAQTGRPLPGATVTFDTTPVIAVDADEQGRFRAEGVPDEAVTVRGYAVDYVTADVVLPAGVTELTVRLASGFSEEIVVVGRATEVARKNLANAVSTVKGSELTNGAPAQTVESALQGKVAGANIQSNGGAPGGGLQLKLRGVSTINGRSDPLYVVDGVIVSDVAIPNGISAVTRSSAGSNASSTQDAQVNRIADINPEDIENIEILKGASAAAIYGSKASNGVVIITTKRGRGSESNDPAISFAQRVGVYQLSNKLGTRRFNDVEEAVGVWGESARDAWNGQFYDHEEQLAGGLAPARETALSATGSLNQGRTTYYASGLLRDDEGIIDRTGYEKQSLRVNLTQKLGERAEVRVNTNLTHSLAARGISNNDNSGTSHYMVLPSTPSFLDLGAVADGTYPLNPFIGSNANPLQTAALMQNDEDVWRMMGSATFEWKLYKSDDDTQSVTVFSDFGVDRFQQKNTLLFPPELHFEPIDDGLPGTSLFATSENLNMNGGANLVHSYKPQGSSLLSSATTSAGVQLEQRGLDTLYLVARNLNSGMPNVDSGTNQNATQRHNKIRDRGVYLQEELLLLDERLTLGAALRAEQSSVNGDPNKLYFYPKVATAYRLQVLPSFFNEFKLRAAYGQTGNQPLYGMKFSPLNATGNIEGEPGLVGSGIAGDPNIRPERQQEVELGMDLVALDGDAYFELTVYQRNISDMLLQRAVAPSTGYTTQFFNGGTMRNRGVELALQVAPVRREGLRWDSRATFALNRSLITSLPDDVPAFTTGGFGTSLGAFRIEEGASATQIVGNNGLLADGVTPNVVKLGDTEPDFRVSFSNTLQLGNFRAHLLMDWLQGSSIINLTRFLYDLGQNTPDYQAGQERLNAWSENLQTSAYIEDGTFLKVRELSLSYDLPRTWYQGTVPGVKSARLAVSGRNLLTFTRYSGLDPEVSNFGNQPIARNIDVAPYPPSRSYWGSIELGF